MPNQEQSYTSEEALVKIAGNQCNEHILAALKNYHGKRFPKTLEKAVYDMSESIMHDPVTTVSIEELGLSQAHRLYRFLNSSGKRPCVSLDELKGLPVIGAEFHLRKEAVGIHEKLLTLNMAQYQNGCPIPLSEEEAGLAGVEEDILVEVRMNPSYYPITVANWELMRKIIPIDDSYFFMSITPPPKNTRQIKQLQSLANIIYADRYETIEKDPLSLLSNFVQKHVYDVFKAVLIFGPLFGGMSLFYYVDDLARNFLGANASQAIALISALGFGVSIPFFLFSKRIQDGLEKLGVYEEYGEIDLGEYYLGQTTRLEDGEWHSAAVLRKLNGKIPLYNNRGRDYQLNLYSGFGDIFPKQAYYISMGYLDNKIFEIVEREAGNVTINEAVKMPKKEIANVLNKINNYIIASKKLAEVTRSGQRIISGFAVN